MELVLILIFAPIVLTLLIFLIYGELPELLESFSEEVLKPPCSHDQIERRVPKHSPSTAPTIRSPAQSKDEVEKLRYFQDLVKIEECVLATEEQLLQLVSKHNAYQR